MTPAKILLIASCLCLAASPALAGKAGREAADQTLGMALMSAMVAPNGELVADKSLGAVSSQRLGTGSYEIRFARTLYGCTPVAASYSGHGGVQIAGPYGTGNDRWQLITYDREGNRTNSQFTILNYCWR